MKGLYIHIPFCVKKCDYCDFLSFPIRREGEYIDALIRELSVHIGKPVDTIFIGGGTPSVISTDSLKKLTDFIGEHFLCNVKEYTVEVNPKTIDKNKCSILKSGGVNRISMGLQSAWDDELKLLGRIHSVKDFDASYEALREAGFENINIDVISSLPYSDMRKWEKTLEYVVKKKPQHVSAYSLIIEEGTPFYDRFHEAYERQCMGEATGILPDEDEERRIYSFTNSFLSVAGYERYEISNYAAEGFKCRHNLKYWSMDEYIGAGLGASGYEDGVRYKNTSDLDRFISDPFFEREKDELDERSYFKEYIFMGLRKTEGIVLNGRLSEIISDAVSSLKENGLLSVSGDRIYLTDRGIDLENYVDSVLCDVIDESYE